MKLRSDTIDNIGINHPKEFNSKDELYYLNRIGIFFCLCFILSHRLTFLPNLFGENVLFITAFCMTTLLLLNFHKFKLPFLYTYPRAVNIAIIALLSLSFYALISSYMNGGPYRLSSQFVAKVVFFVLLFWFISADKNQIKLMIEPYVIFCTILSVIGLVAVILVNFEIVNYDNWRISISDIIGYEFHSTFGYWRFSFPFGLGIFIPLEDIRFFGFSYHRLAGYATEPNVYALFLEPALFYSFFMYKNSSGNKFYKFSVIAIFLCLVSVLSGATLVIFLTLPLLYLTRKYGLARWVLLPICILAFYYIDANWSAFSDRAYIKGMASNVYLSTRLGTIHGQVMLMIDSLLDARFTGKAMLDSGGPIIISLITDMGIIGLGIFLIVVFICTYYSFKLLFFSKKYYIFGVAFLAQIMHSMKAGFYDLFLSLYVMFLLFAAVRLNESRDDAVDSPSANSVLPLPVK